MHYAESQWSSSIPFTSNKKSIPYQIPLRNKRAKGYINHTFLIPCLLIQTGRGSAVQHRQKKKQTPKKKKKGSKRELRVWRIYWEGGEGSDFSRVSWAFSRKGLNPSCRVRYPNDKAPITTIPDLIAFIFVLWSIFLSLPPSHSLFASSELSKPDQSERNIRGNQRNDQHRFT